MNATLRGLETVLQRMDSQSIHQLPAAPATSSSAWTPLLRSHLDHVVPLAEKWRGTLDNILIFVALFSAVITTFFNQSLTALSEDPGSKTNQHLANITDILLLFLGEDRHALNLSQVVEFKPDPYVARSNFFWSLSLIISISIACLAVTTRGFITKLARSSYNQAHKKTTELHLHWRQAEEFLGPTVEILLQMLVVPVALFLVGLLDSLISTSLPSAKSSSKLVLAGGIVSCICCVIVAMFTVYTIVRMRPNSYLGSWLTRPKNTTSSSCSSRTELVSSTVSVKRPSIFGKATSWLRPSLGGSWVVLPTPDVEAASGRSIGKQKYWQRFFRHLTTRDTAVPGSGVRDSPRKPNWEMELLPPEGHAAYHSVISTTHDDDTLHQAITILPSLLDHRRRQAAKEDLPEDSLYATDDEGKTFRHLLSLDVSIRCNVAAADNVTKSLLCDHNNLPAAQRSIASQEHITPPILHLLMSIMSQSARNAYNYNSFDILPKQAPLLGLFFLPFEELQLDEATSSHREQLRLQVINHAYHFLFSLSGIEEATDALDLFAPVQAMKVDIPAILSLQVQSWNLQSRPFLLNLVPEGLGMGMVFKITQNYYCFRSLVKLIFTPSISSVTLKDMAEAIHQVILFHRDEFHGTPSESLDLFVVTHGFLQSLSYAISDKNFNHAGSAFGWNALFKTCIMLIHFIFDQRRVPLPTNEFYPPVLLHGVIVTILGQIRRYNMAQNFQVPVETQEVLLSIQTGEYSEGDKAILLNAFHSIDPSFLPFLSI
ncbi:hypothetical protein H0H87_001481 [Tephrocybe sp. NHM501043]|nr:hypothetical protein H0H87_001481 [Tephrocybe sp. NHM501043]